MFQRNGFFREGSVKWDMKNSNGPDKPREDLLTRLGQEIRPDSGAWEVSCGTKGRGKANEKGFIFRG